MSVCIFTIPLLVWSSAARLGWLGICKMSMWSDQSNLWRRNSVEISLPDVKESNETDGWLVLIYEKRWMVIRSFKVWAGISNTSVFRFEASCLSSHNHLISYCPRYDEELISWNSNNCLTKTEITHQQSHNILGIKAQKAQVFISL